MRDIANYHQCAGNGNAGINNTHRQLDGRGCLIHAGNHAHDGTAFINKKYTENHAYDGNNCFKNLIDILTEIALNLYFILGASILTTLSLLIHEREMSFCLFRLSLIYFNNIL